MEAWYVGPAFEHYRCYTVWVIPTRKTRVVNQLNWFPQKLAMPIASQLDLIGAALRDLNFLIKAPNSEYIIGNLPDSERDMLYDTSILLQQNLVNPTNTKQVPKDKPIHPLPPQSQPAPSLRVEPRKVSKPTPAVHIDAPTPRRSTRLTSQPKRYDPGSAYLSLNSGRLTHSQHILHTRLPPLCLPSFQQGRPNHRLQLPFTTVPSLCLPRHQP